MNGFLKSKLVLEMSMGTKGLYTQVLLGLLDA